MTTRDGSSDSSAIRAAKGQFSLDRQPRPLIFSLMQLLLPLVCWLAYLWGGNDFTPVLARSAPLTAEVKTLAFPGAEGFGAYAKGGRGGVLLEVTNLNDNGPGSLRAAIEAEGPRFVIFRTSGTIELMSTLTIANPYITIVGQTAPGGGITLKNHPSHGDPTVAVRTHDVIIRYLRIRPGPSKQESTTLDALTIGSASEEVFNVIIDHCSLSWATDEVLNTWYASHDITIQWSIIAEALDCSTHEEGCHSKGMLIGSKGSGNVSVHHNLFAHNGERNPMIKTNHGTVDVVNNLIYNMGGGIMSYDDYGSPALNVVGNYFKYGSQTAAGHYEITTHTGDDAQHSYGHSLFVVDNLGPYRATQTQGQQLLVAPGSRRYLIPQRFDAPAITTTSAADAYTAVLANAGVNLPGRDAVDIRILSNVLQGTGKRIDNPAEVGGWPQLAAGIPPIDSDHDGLPDEWELLHGLNPADPNDGSAGAADDGYTDLENYLNSLSVHYVYLPVINSANAN